MVFISTPGRARSDSAVLYINGIHGLSETKQAFKIVRVNKMSLLNCFAFGTVQDDRTFGCEDLKFIEVTSQKS